MIRDDTHFLCRKMLYCETVIGEISAISCQNLSLALLCAKMLSRMPALIAFGTHVVLYTLISTVENTAKTKTSTGTCHLRIKMTPGMFSSRSPEKAVIISYCTRL